MKEVFFMNDTFMKEKPVGPLLASMALPMFFSMLVNSLYNIVDSFFVAQISTLTCISCAEPDQFSCHWFWYWYQFQGVLSSWRRK